MEKRLNLPINVISRYLIDCQIRELKGSSLPAGQKPPYLCLQMLCSMVPSTQLSHTTLQFIRYSTLLYNVKKLKDGCLNEHILSNILNVLVAITEAPELRMEFLQSSLGSLLVDTNAGLIKGGVDKYWRKLVAFIETVLQYYGITPEMEKCLSSDAYHPSPKGRRTRRNPGRDCILSPSKQQKLVEDLVPYVVVVNATSDGSYPSDLMDVQELDEHSLAQSPPESSQLKDSLTNIPSLREVQVKLEPAYDQNSSAANVTVSSQDAALVDCPQLTGVSAPGGISTEGEVAAPRGDTCEGLRGIFMNAKPATSDMEWTSDESECIGPSENLEQLMPRMYSIEHDFLSPPKASPSPRACRRKWTEEEHACLLEGVRLLGEGRWKEIKNMYKDVLKDRAAVHLKDRYRNTEGKRGKRKEQKQNT